MTDVENERTIDESVDAIMAIANDPLALRSRLQDLITENRSLKLQLSEQTSSENNIKGKKYKQAQKLVQVDALEILLNTL